VCSIEKIDEEIEYGKFYVHSLGDEDSAESRPLEADDIWPHWSEGVPTKLRKTLWSPAFYLGKVHHKERLSSESLELEWRGPYLLSVLRENYSLLPSSKYSRQWNGVYRIFSPETAINRICGEDPTGTLYLGRAGSERGWSILRTRIQEIARKAHHATSGWSYSDLLRKKFPWESLAIEWAYTEKRLNYRGDPIPGAKVAEGWLLSCYNDSFGEYPPMNQEG
jgi:hypothetical protein